MNLMTIILITARFPRFLCVSENISDFLLRVLMLLIFKLIVKIPVVGMGVGNGL